MRRTAFFAFVLLTTLPLLDCGTSEPFDRTRPRVGLVLKTFNNPFFNNLQEGAEEAAQELGLDLIVQAPERELDFEEQKRIIEHLAQTGVDVLLIAPSGSKEMLPSITIANQAGIPVVILDTRLDEEAAREAGIRIETFVGIDSYAGGKAVAEFVAGLPLESASVAILEGIRGHETGDSRLKGFLDAADRIPTLKVVASQSASWEREQGYTVAASLLRAHPEVNVLFACNDLMALGAIDAIADLGRSGQIEVIGFDAVEEARIAIAQGTLRASVGQFPSEIGRLAVEQAARIVARESVPDHVSIPIELITKENLYKVTW